MAIPFGYLSHIFCSSSLLRHSCWGRLEMFIYFWSKEKRGNLSITFYCCSLLVRCQKKQEELCIKEITNRNKTTTEHMITTDKNHMRLSFLSFTRFVSMGARYAEKLSNKRQPIAYWIIPFCCYICYIQIILLFFYCLLISIFCLAATHVYTFAQIILLLHYYTIVVFFFVVFVL